MAGETDLSLMLASLHVAARDEPVVFVTVPDDHPFEVLATVRETEGLTVVISQSEADRNGLRYEFVGAWLTLSVHSDLAAVGLTAAFSTALAESGISCNVLAGHFHDHLVVPWDRRHDAVDAIGALRLKNERE